MDLREKNLKELAKLLFSRKYEYVDEKQKIKGKSGKTWIFDAIIIGDGKFGVFIRDWKREISITQIRQLHKACKDVEEIEGGVMVCNLSSEFSENYGETFGIQLLDRGTIISKIRTTYF